MSFSLQKMVILSLCLITSLGITLVPSASYAHLTPIHTVQEMQQKKEALKFLAKRLSKHETMELEDIREELLTSLRANRETLQTRQSTPLDEKLIRAFERSEQSILDLQDKEQLINEEKQQIANLVSAHNYIFSLTRYMSEEGGNDPGYCCLCVPFFLFTIPVDFAFLPLSFIATIVTEFL